MFVKVFNDVQKYIYAAINMECVVVSLLCNEYLIQIYVQSTYFLWTTSTLQKLFPRKQKIGLILAKNHNHNEDH